MNEVAEKKILLSAEEYGRFLNQIDLLEKKLDKLRYVKSNPKQYSKEDWYDDTVYQQMLYEERRLIEAINKIKDDQSLIEVIDQLPNCPTIQVGDTMRVNLVFDENDIEEMTIKLVTTGSDFSEDIIDISLDSPLGQAIYQKEVSETINYFVEDRQMSVEILEKMNSCEKTITENIKSK